MYNIYCSHSVSNLHNIMQKYIFQIMCELIMRENDMNKCKCLDFFF